MGDAPFVIGLTSIFVGTSFVGARWFRKLSPSTSGVRIVMLTPIPLPALIGGLCIFMIVDAYTTSAAECGVDACGMVAAFSMLGLLLAVIVYALGMFSAAFALALTKTPAIGEDK